MTGKDNRIREAWLNHHPKCKACTKFLYKTIAESDKTGTVEPHKIRPKCLAGIDLYLAFVRIIMRGRCTCD